MSGYHGHESIHRVDINPKKRMLSSYARDPKARMPTPDEPFITSVSEINDWLRCRALHNWRTYAQLAPKARSAALGMGSLTHDVIERYYKVPWRKRNPTQMTKLTALAFQKTKEKVELDDRNLVRAMSVGYSEWTRDKSNEYNDEAIGLRDCAPEDRHELKLVPDGSIIVVGNIDLRFVPFNKKRTMAMLETKTASQMKAETWEWRMQWLTYRWFLGEAYPKLRQYLIYPTVLRKQMPGPRVKADLFSREPIEFGEDEVEQWRKDTIRICLEMIGAAVFPTYSSDCSWRCEFKNACLLRGDPDQLKHVLSTEFKPREHRKT